MLLEGLRFGTNCTWRFLKKVKNTSQTILNNTLGQYILKTGLWKRLQKRKWLILVGSRSSLPQLKRLLDSVVKNCQNDEQCVQYYQNSYNYQPNVTYHKGLTNTYHTYQVGLTIKNILFLTKYKGPPRSLIFQNYSDHPILI